MDVFRFGFRYWKRNLPLSLVARLMGFLALLADLLLPMLSALIIDYCIRSSEVSGDNLFSFLLSGSYGEIHSLELFFSIAKIYLFLIGLKVLLNYGKNILNQKLGLNLETDLRRATYRQLMTLDSETISKYNTGELLTTINFDTIMYKDMFCRILPGIYDSVFVLVLAVVMLGLIHPALLLIPLIVIPFFGATLMKFKKIARANFTAIRKCNSAMNLTVQENIEALRIVRSFTNEEREKKKFDRVNEALSFENIHQVKTSAKFEAIFNLIRQGAYIGSIAVAAVLIMRGQILLGYLVTCTEYIIRIMNYITIINNMIFQMQQQLVAGKKMMDFMAAKTLIPSGTEPVNGEISRGEGDQADPLMKVDLKILHGSMELDGQKVLENINIDIPFGTHLGVVGTTGSGKSLLLESFIRVHDLTEGRILLNDKDIRTYDLNALREQFAYVFQEVFLFSNTIDSNIAYGDPSIDHEEVITAAMHARAHGFIQKLTDGYDTIIGERGLGISGGQKQRISIARALLKYAPVLVLDDSTSALDVRTEQELLEEIEKNYHRQTVILSAHRLSSVVDCDEILYMEDGRILERGTFEELMKLNGRFAAVYRLQESQKKEALSDEAFGKEEVHG